MTTPRLRMDRIREILRQKWGLDRTHREIARSVGCSVDAVWNVVARAAAAGLDLGVVDALDGRELEARVHGVRVEPTTTTRELPDFAAVHREHKRPGVTLALLHLEYAVIDDVPMGLAYQRHVALLRLTHALEGSARTRRRRRSRASIRAEVGQLDLHHPLPTELRGGAPLGNHLVGGSGVGGSDAGSRGWGVRIGRRPRSSSRRRSSAARWAASMRSSCGCTFFMTCLEAPGA
jgi:hypothetical protein